MIKINMRKILIIIIFYLFSSLTVNAKTLINYSIFIEEDFDTIMLINRYSDKSISGKIISYGGYKWLEKIYTESTPSNSSTYITPGRYAYGDNKDNYTRSKYIINNFSFEFSYRGDDHIVNFISPSAIQNIEGFISRNEAFALATYNPKVAWYAGTFTPIKSINNFKFIAKNNSLTLCKILTESEVINSINREINTNIINSLKCDSDNNLSSSEGTEINTAVDTQSDKSKKFYELNWYNLDNPKNHYIEITGSNSKVNIIETEIYLKGQKDIDEYTQLLFGEKNSVAKMLIVDNPDFSYSIYINYIDEGYVSLDDWKDVKPKKLLEEMIVQAKDDVTGVKWLIEPKISKNNHVTYSYEVSWNDGKKSIETQILALGKKGYNDINFVSSTSKGYTENDLEKMALEFANSIEFKEGFKHSDYKSGDKVAAIGIGGLVAGTLGIKALAKVGILAKFLPFLAKFWWIILAPIVAIFGLFGNKDKEDAPIKKTRTRKKKKD